MNNQKYQKIVAKNVKKEKVVKDSLLAFLGGGFLGVIGQALIDLFKYTLKLNFAQACAFMSICVIFITSILTLLGLYRYIGKIFGAGLFIPTTGFANSVTSSAIEGRSEGFIIGVGGSMFSLAGSVITYGIVSAFFLLIVKNFLIMMGVK